MSRNKKALLVVGKQEDPSTRHRAEILLARFEAAGYRCGLTHVPKGLFGRVALLFKCRGNDVVVLFRKLLRPLECAVLRRMAPCIIFDLDDAVMLVECRWGVPVTDKYMGRFRNIARLADAVVAGNEYLASFATAENRKVIVLPTPIDTERYVPPTNEKEGAEVVVGWIGMKGNLPYLKKLAPVFRRLAERHPNFALMVICSDFPEIEGVRVIKRKWSVEDEVSFLQEIDIGIMPLTDDPWSRGKCGFKILEYFGVGKPAVASPVGINKDIVIHGVNGFHAQTEEQWEECLSRLISDSELRKAMGREGRRCVEEKYSLDAYAKRYISLLDELAG